MIAIRRVTAALATVLLTGGGVLVGGGADAATGGVRVTRWVDGDTVVTTQEPCG